MDVAEEQGFMVVSVNQHVDRTPEEIVELLDYLEEKFPSIDGSRVYATGFSMGSVKTWALSETYPERFAGVAPMSGSFEPEATAIPETAIPVIYFAGHESPLTEYPHTSCDSERCGDGEAGWLDARLAAMFAQNGVEEDWEFDRSQEANWGLAPTSTSIVEDSLFDNVSVQVNSYESGDGQTITQLASVRNVAHEATPIEAQIAWDFLSKFSRGDDGEIVTAAADSKRQSEPPILAILLIAAAVLVVVVIVVTVTLRRRARAQAGA
ncbi:hypothetical protein J7E68_14880 [Microbacterium sp. ISL-103]|uniref:alpha/beta hydrolase-fold protein n=1 Tax=Microbacterium sp. ISL-103 TaxID=2819156 RepID=UPI001BE9BF5E|nr:alpha/beta hydrolase-fold protein [Microbacterium sp. ISL-103]MBT2475822.1 hypothetical protein [Microbacterium sp. ISL-103]